MVEQVLGQDAPELAREAQFFLDEAFRWGERITRRQRLAVCEVSGVDEDTGIVYPCQTLATVEESGRHICLRHRTYEWVRRTALGYDGNTPRRAP